MNQDPNQVPQQIQTPLPEGATEPVGIRPEFVAGNLTEKLAQGLIDQDRHSSPAGLETPVNPVTAKRSHRGLFVGLGAAAAGAGLATATFLGLSKGGSTAHEAGPTGNPTGVTNTENSHPSSVHSSSKQSHAPSTAQPTPTTTSELGLVQAEPLVAQVTSDAPYGSKAVIDILYLDLQLANQTNKAAFLQAALGTNTQTELYQNLSRLQQQQYLWLETHEQEKLAYFIKVVDAEQAAPNSLEWNITTEEENMGTIYRYRENITLSKDQQPDGTQQWLIGAVNSSVQVN